MKFSGNAAVPQDPAVDAGEVFVVFRKFARPPTSPFAMNVLVVANVRRAREPVSVVPFTHADAWSR